MMKLTYKCAPRVLFLLCRYGTLLFAGYAIAYLWRICDLESYSSWGKFYAIWVSGLYGALSTGYLLLVEYCSWKQTDLLRAFEPRLRRFFSYDDMTYLFLPAFLGLEIAGPFLKNVYFWLSIAYLGLILIKSGLFLGGLIDYVRLLEKQSQPRISRALAAWIVATAILVYSPISAYHMQRTALTGDEPHYLLITHSLWHDHDTNLYNNYQNRDYQAFYPYELQPAQGDQVNDTTMYSYRHKGGFPHTLLPGYIVGGHRGVVAQLNILTALLGLQVFLLSYEIFASLTAALFCWLSVALTIPFLIYMDQVYPETLAALLTVWSARRIYGMHRDLSWKNRKMWLNCALIVGAAFAMLLLKTRYLPLAGTILFYLLVQLFQHHVPVGHRRRMLAIIGLVLLCMAIALFLIDTFLFDHMFRDRFTDTKYMAWMLRGYNPLSGVLGLLFDQEYGLFLYTPLYMLAFVGLGLLTRREWTRVWPLLLIFSANYLVVCLWPLWHAAPTPPTRYILPVLPLLGVFGTKLYLHPSRCLKGILLGVCGIWSLLAGWIVALNPWWRYNWADGTNNFLEMLSLRLSINLPNIFPSFIRWSPATPYLTFLGIGVIGIMIYLFRNNDTVVLRLFPRDVTRECQWFMMLLICVGLGLGGLVFGKKVPTTVLEAEDRLDVLPSGGERIPQTKDPWDNQIYLREWKYYGWKLNPGDRLRTRPKLYNTLPSSQRGAAIPWDMEILARAQLDQKQPKQFPVLVVLVNGEETQRITMSSTGWQTYHVPLTVNDRRPSLELRHQDPPVPTTGAIIVDKLRFH